MRCWNVGDELLEAFAFGPSDVDGQTRDPLGLIVCQSNDEEVWIGANHTNGYETLVVARELKRKKACSGSTRQARAWTRRTLARST